MRDLPDTMSTQKAQSTEINVADYIDDLDWAERGSALPPQFGKQLRLIRNTLELSQKAFSEKVGISRQQLSNLERGLQGRIQAKTKYGIAETIQHARKLIERLVEQGEITSEVFEFLFPNIPGAADFVKYFESRIKRYHDDPLPRITLMDMGNQLAKYRLARGFTQAQLARATGLSQDEISRLEQGRFYGDWLAKLKQITEALNLHPKQLLHVKKSGMKKRARSS